MSKLKKKKKKKNKAGAEYPQTSYKGMCSRNQSPHPAAWPGAEPLYTLAVPLVSKAQILAC